jgi:hypothetical protein
MKDIIVAVTGLMLLVMVWVGWQQFEIWRGSEVKNTVCTMEAKLCPDGSSVGRSGPRCEFAPCPTAKKVSGIYGKAVMGPRCPVVQNPPDDLCGDTPYIGILVVTSANGERDIQEFSTDANGVFDVMVAPGDYEIRSQKNGPIFPRCMSKGNIYIEENKKTETEVYCDTGIR